MYKGGAYPSAMLHYGTDRLVEDRIRYEQIAFVECQEGDGDEPELRRQWFFAAPAGVPSSIEWARANGKVARAWKFGYQHVGDYRPGPHPPVFPATDVPYALWYLDFYRDTCSLTWTPAACEAFP